MYGPGQFIDDDPAVAAELIERAAFGHLVVAGDAGLMSTPLPVLVDRAAGPTPGIARLRGHLARGNAVWRQAPCPALVIVPVDDTYISPSWYATKREHGRVVPTWNYEVVHVHGELIAHDDASWVGALVRELTERHEAWRDEPWSVDDPPPGFVEAQLRAIVGIEIVAERVQAKRKLSQNRSVADQAGVVAGLDDQASSGAAAIAASMRDLLP